jgi:class 3 adenylate cyclase
VAISVNDRVDKRVKPLDPIKQKPRNFDRGKLAQSKRIRQRCGVHEGKIIAGNGSHGAAGCRRCGTARHQ